MGKKQSYKFIGNIDKVFQTEEITTIFQELDVKVSVIFFFIKRFFFRVIHNKWQTDVIGNPKCKSWFVESQDIALQVRSWNISC